MKTIFCYIIVESIYMSNGIYLYSFNPYFCFYYVIFALRALTAITFKIASYCVLVLMGIEMM
jgi:hypothetical protein